jgi:hypothetical protein
MSNVNRRSFLKAPMVTPDRLALAGATPDAGTTAAPNRGTALNRRTFLQSTAGAAAGVAVVTGGPKLAVAALGGGTGTGPAAVITKPSGPAPREPVMAYVRDAARGEVTVLSGKRETTYRDPALAKRLIDAAR